MWIADQWKDYEVIDCSKGEKLERWGQWMETYERPLSPQQERRRGMGILQSPGTVADSL